MTGVVVFIIRILLALCLYAFIGVIFMTIWRQLKAQVKILSPELNNFLRLVPVDMDGFETLEIKQTEVILGRDPNNKIFIPNETVSAQHARLYFSEQHWWINDLNSTNGTYLNNELIDRPCVLTDNDVIMIGQAKFAIQIITAAG